MDLETGNMKKTFISVIIPAMNEETTIALCIKKAKQGIQNVGLSGEIIVVDSSTDKTAEIAIQNGARVIIPPKKGYGNAYQAGFSQAKGNILIIGDADNTYDFLDIPKLIEPIQQGRADYVIGSRLKGTIKKGAMPWLHKYIGNPFLTRLLNWTFKTQFSDCHSGFRAITREALDSLSLHTGGMEFASEMMIAAAKAKLKTAEIPITYYPRIGPSKLHSFADGWRHVRFIVLMRPLPFLGIPGLLFAIMGIILMGLVQLRGSIESHSLHSFIMGAIFLTGGIQFVMTGFTIKTYAITHGFDSDESRIKKWISYPRLELILFSGIFLLFIGFLSGISVISAWIQTSFGEITQVTNAVLSLCAVSCGLQFICTALLSSMMLLRTEREEMF